MDNAAESAAIAADSSRVSTMSGGFDRFPDSEACVCDHRFGTGSGASRRRVNAGRELRISARQYVLCPSVTPDSPRSFAEGRKGWPQSAARAADPSNNQAIDNKLDKIPPPMSDDLDIFNH